jgi:hypothetical protein
MYAVPVVYDLSPDLDTYWGGYTVLGVWGVLIFTLVGLVTSMVYGMVCVSGQTVYACGRGGLSCPESGLTFPDEFPEDLKKIYIEQLEGKSKGWLNLPWSEYHSTLAALNKKYLY